MQMALSICPDTPVSRAWLFDQTNYNENLKRAQLLYIRLDVTQPPSVFCQSRKASYKCSLPFMPAYWLGCLLFSEHDIYLFSRHYVFTRQGW